MKILWVVMALLLLSTSIVLATDIVTSQMSGVVTLQLGQSFTVENFAMAIVDVEFRGISAYDFQDKPLIGCFSLANYHTGELYYLNVLPGVKTIKYIDDKHYVVFTFIKVTHDMVKFRYAVKQKRSYP